jgi:chaperonin GroES
MNEMTTPTFHRVLIKQDEPVEKKTESGIILTDGATHEMNRNKLKKGTIVKLGTGRRLDDGSIAKWIFKVGDVVLFGYHAGTPVVIDDEEYRIVQDEDVHLILDGEPRVL